MKAKWSRVITLPRHHLETYKLAYFFTLYILFIILVDLISSRSGILPPKMALVNFYLIIPLIGGYFSKEEKIGCALNFIGYSSLYILFVPIVLEVIRISYLDVTVVASIVYWFLGPFSFYVGSVAKNYKALAILYPIILLALDFSKIDLHYYPFSSYFMIFGSIFNGVVMISWIWRNYKK